VASANVSAGTQSLTLGSLALTNGTGLASNYQIATSGNTGTIGVATLALNGAKTYDSTTAFAASTFGTGGTISTGINGETLIVAGAGLVGSANVSAGTQSLTLGSLALTNGTGLASNYQIATSGNTGTISPATLSYVATANGMIYGGTVPGLSGTVTGFVNGQNVGSATTGTLAFNTTANALTNVGGFAITGSGLTANNGNYTFQQAAANSTAFTISPATLSYNATPSTQTYGVGFPTFTGTVTGFVNGQNLGSATTGTAVYTANATDLSPAGTYGIFGSGLTANYGNYVFVQAAGNATALTLNGQPSPPPNQPPSNNTNTNNVVINFQTNTNTTPINVPFTPNELASNRNNDANPASLPPFDALTKNNGLSFPPISQYDPNQYSPLKLPDYDNDDSESTIFTILARGVSPGQGANYMIDGFWNGSDPTWPGPGNVKLPDKLMFSNGSAPNVTPTVDTGFPIVAGKTNFAALLKNGPVMIGGPADQTPAQWLLATGMSPDGKDIICDDPQTGGLVELSYDPATETVGGITGVYNPKTNSFVALAVSDNDIPTNDAAGLAGLQSFSPSTYYAVTVH
jgi:hypothetical protein